MKTTMLVALFAAGLGVAVPAVAATAAACCSGSSCCGGLCCPW